LKVDGYTANLLIAWSLLYPVIFAAITFVVGVVFLPETKNVDITKD
jgi:hypothetical protein